LELCIALDARQATQGIRGPSFVRVVAGRGHRQHPADRLDSVRPTVVIDEGDHHLGPRSSSSHGEIRGRLAEDHVRAAEFPVFALQFLQARAFVRRYPGPPPVTALSAVNATA